VIALYISPSEVKREWLEIFMGIATIRRAIRPSVTSISSHNFTDRGLKFGMNNTHINGSKFGKQNFDILSKS